MSYDKLTAFVPAHKQAHPEHKPGQIVFSPEPGPNTVINPLGFVDTTLSPKKLSFDGWYEEQGWKDFHAGIMSLDDADSTRYLMYMAWCAGQVNV